MRSSSSARYVIPVALGALAGSIVCASPASAATLPAADAIYSVQYLDAAGDASIWDATPGMPTTIVEVAGSPVVAPAEITDSAYDPTTETAYVIGNGYSTPCTLWSVTISPPALTYIADITTDGTNPVPADCSAFDILPDGTAYVVVARSTLATIDLATGIVTTVAAVTLGGNPMESLSWIKYDAATDTTFAMSYDGGLHELDLATGVLTFLAGFDLTGGQAHDADIDSAGTLWFGSWNVSLTLWSFDPADPLATAGPEGGAVAGWESDTLWIQPTVEVAVDAGPELAATGTDDGAAIAAAALALMALGALLFWRRRATS